METYVTIELEGGTDAAEDLRRLEVWLRADEELAPLVVRRERPADESMGVAYDLLLMILQETLQATALTLLRALRNHLRNQPGDSLSVTVRAGDVECVLTGRDALTRGELEAMAARIRQTLEN
ncbi:effector-associated constant component EACC1 [Actinacidiphila sp. bgisy160]|uniref:effector-associated constant component EACC1 n=1 Tax=Actinacidiphila sp. bgisy160 TaxID=3413796 RepID=UPI003D70E256